MNILEVLAVDIEKPTQVVVGHIDAAGEGWYLEKVIVTCPSERTAHGKLADSDTRKYSFTCNRCE